MSHLITRWNCAEGLESRHLPKHSSYLNIQSTFRRGNPLDLFIPVSAFSRNQSNCSYLSKTILLALGLTKPHFHLIFLTVDCPLFHLALSCSWDAHSECPYNTLNVQSKNTWVGFCISHVIINTSEVVFQNPSAGSLVSLKLFLPKVSSFSNIFQWKNESYIPPVPCKMYRNSIA